MKIKYFLEWSLDKAVTLFVAYLPDIHMTAISKLGKNNIASSGFNGE